MPDARSLIPVRARAYLGVKWRHLGRDPARGLDCVGLVLRAAEDVGLLQGVAFPSYGRRPEGYRLTAEVARHCRPVPMAEMAPGDILTFAGVERLPCHLAIVTETRPAVLIIHAWAEHGRVAEHSLHGFSGGAPTGCWRIQRSEDRGQKAEAGKQLSGLCHPSSAL